MSYKSKYTGPQIDDVLDSVEGKQNEIEDLASIRSGAAKGATALQSYTEKYTGTITGIKMNGASKGTSGVVDLGTVITSHQDISGKADKSSLAAVATSGSYSDLTNKPLHSLNIGTDYLQLTLDNSAGTTFIPIVDSSAYIKHVNGIEYDNDKVYISTSRISFITEFGDGDWEIHKRGDGTKFLSDDGTYKTASGGSGTITGVSANGTSIATSGVANIPAASTSKYGVTKLNSATNSTSTTEAATPSAVKSAYDLANSYKGTVTSVKVDNVSKSQSSGVVDLGYINKQLSTSTSSSMTLSPNVYYRNTSTSLSTLTITLGSVSNSNIINEYFVEFTTRSAGTTVSLPSTIKWANGETPTFEASTTYQISIVNNLGTIQKFK